MDNKTQIIIYFYYIRYSGEKMPEINIDSVTLEKVSSVPEVRRIRKTAFFLLTQKIAENLNRIPFRLNVDAFKSASVRQYQYKLNAELKEKKAQSKFVVLDGHNWLYVFSTEQSEKQSKKSK